jgi:hypothetical protein
MHDNQVGQSDRLKVTVTGLDFQLDQTAFGEHVAETRVEGEQQEYVLKPGDQVEQKDAFFDAFLGGLKAVHKPSTD